MRIALTTGVYDLLHHGHRALFVRAREHCDYLIVAVASDWLTRVQKGITRPIRGQAQRLADVLACEGADRAYVTDDLDFSHLTGIIDLIILGGDQQSVRTGSIPWVRIARTDGISTSGIIAAG